MPTTKITSRELSRQTARAKKAARSGPVVITDHGHPTHVLLTYEHYQDLAAAKQSIIHPLGQPGGIENIDLEIPRRNDRPRPAELTSPGREP